MAAQEKTACLQVPDSCVAQAVLVLDVVLVLAPALGRGLGFGLLPGGSFGYGCLSCGVDRRRSASGGGSGGCEAGGGEGGRRMGLVG